MHHPMYYILLILELDVESSTLRAVLGISGHAAHLSPLKEPGIKTAVATNIINSVDDVCHSTSIPALYNPK